MQDDAMEDALMPAISFETPGPPENQKRYYDFFLYLEAYLLAWKSAYILKPSAISAQIGASNRSKTQSGLGDAPTVNELIIRF
mmetsp:Transcript_36285/g.67037  ORF Transcript_36285/g.67037 Transcript_36285/m.67037 type:complete len:83 (-) Transcript_36285:46-294(-)